MVAVVAVGWVADGKVLKNPASVFPFRSKVSNVRLCKSLFFLLTLFLTRLYPPDDSELEPAVERHEQAVIHAGTASLRSALVDALMEHGRLEGAELRRVLAEAD
jgi:hypothetical protein